MQEANLDSDTIKTKSDSELLLVFNNWEKYQKETVQLVIEELTARGRQLDPIKLASYRYYDQNISSNVETARSDNPWSLNSNVTADPDAPFLYSRRSVFGFSIFFGVFFASLILAFNIRKTGHDRGVWLTILFGVFYTILQINIIPVPSHGLTWITSAIGSLILNFVLWPKFIGESLMYRKRPVVLPALIGIILMSLLVYILLKVDGVL